MFENPGLILMFTHIAAAVLGYFMCHWLTMRAGEAFTHESENPVESARKGRDWSLRTLPSYVILLLVAALVLVGIGVQSALSQRASAQHDQCISDWGDELIAATTNRSEATQALEKAQTNRDDALDALLVAAIGAQDQSQKEQEQTTKPLVKRYVEAVKAKEQATENAADTRKANPLPVLSCD